MERFINNGMDCVVLARSGDRAIIAIINAKQTPFVVARHEAGMDSWHWGDYFTYLKSAVEYFLS